MFTDRVISCLKTGGISRLFRGALIDYLVSDGRIMYWDTLDVILVKESDGWHIGWYI